MAKILIVEDDEAILMGLSDDLQAEGHDVAAARDGREGLRRASDPAFDLIILDIHLPLMSGFEVCRKLRESGVKTPVLMLTAAKTEEMDKVTGLELGADDYMTKPFGSRELMARMKAILRRTEDRRATEDVVRFGDVCVDFKRHEVSRDGRDIYLTALEFKILRHLTARRGEPVSRDELLDAVWGKAIVSSRTIEPHIVYLRKKLEKDPSRPEHILSVRGVGYKFKA